jgi:hypothetical protein
MATTTTKEQAMTTTYQQLIIAAANEAKNCQQSMKDGRWTPTKAIAYETALLAVMHHVNDNGGKASRIKIEDEIDIVVANIGAEVAA